MPGLSQGTDSLHLNTDNAFAGNFLREGLGSGNPFLRASHPAPAGMAAAAIFPPAQAVQGSHFPTSITVKIGLASFSDGTQKYYGRGDLLFVESDPSRSVQGYTMCYSIWHLNRRLKEIALDRERLVREERERSAGGRQASSSSTLGKRSRDQNALLDFLPGTLGDLTRMLNYAGVVYGNKDVGTAGLVPGHRNAISQPETGVIYSGEAEIPSIWPDARKGDVVGIMFKVMHRDQVPLLPGEMAAGLPEYMIQGVAHREPGRNVPIYCTDYSQPALEDLCSYTSHVVKQQTHPEKWSGSGLLDFDSQPRRTGADYSIRSFEAGVYVRVGIVKYGANQRAPNTLSLTAMRGRAEWQALRKYTVIVSVDPEMQRIHSDM